MKKKLSILGSTGSIGRSALDVVANFPDRFSVVALAAGKRTDLLAEQVRRFGVKVAAVAEKADAEKLLSAFFVEAERLLGPGGRMVLLLGREMDLPRSNSTSDGSAQPAAFAIAESYEVLVSGRKAKAIKLERKK